MKKVLALTLVLVLAFSMSTVAFAGKITGEAANRAWWTGATYTGPAIAPATSNGTLADENDLGTITTGNKAIIKIFLDTATVVGTNLTWDATDPSTTSGVTKKDIENSKITLRFRASKGSSVIDEYTLEKKTDGHSFVQVKFKDPFVNNNPDGMDFAFRVNLAKSGVTFTEVAFSGNYQNATDDDYGSDTDYYDFAAQNILKPSEFIRVFDGDFGEGVILNMRGLKGSKYFGYADQDVSDADTDNFIKYNAIDAVYHLRTAGNFTNVVNFVTLEDADPDAYVYDGNLKPLGRGKDKLPFADTYYLASAALDVDDEEEPDDFGDDDDDDGYEPDDWGSNTPSGGDDLYPENPHDNPGTGK